LGRSELETALAAPDEPPTTTTKEPTVKVYDVLKNEHKMVKELLEELEGTTSRAAKKREQLFSRLKEALVPHADFEEQVLYPALREHKELQDLTLEAYEEHAVARRLLDELDQSDKSDERWKAKLIVLKEYLNHHVKEEEGEMFKAARGALSSEEAERFAEEYEAFKAGARA
jgi:hemerythrin-like domain-containing protein